MKRILCGPRAVVEAIRAEAGRVQVVYLADGAGARLHDVVAEAKKRNVEVDELPSAALDRLADGIRHQDVVAITGDYPYRSLEDLVGPSPSPTPADGAARPLLLLLLDGIEDPRNLGAILRSAVGLGADGVVLPRDRASPVTAAAVRSSAGASEHARVARVTNLAETIVALRDRGITVVGLAAEAPSPLSTIDLRGPVALVVGSEGRGLRRLTRERCDTLAKLPLLGPVASLNASVAAALALYEVVRQRG